MKDASFFLVVRLSIEPQAVADAMRWLDGALKATFARERAPFEKHMRIERFFGEAEKAYGA